MKLIIIHNKEKLKEHFLKQIFPLFYNARSKRTDPNKEHVYDTIWGSSKESDHIHFRYIERKRLEVAKNVLGIICIVSIIGTFLLSIFFFTSKTVNYLKIISTTLFFVLLLVLIASIRIDWKIKSMTRSAVFDDKFQLSNNINIEWKKKKSEIQSDKNLQNDLYNAFSFENYERINRAIFNGVITNLDAYKDKNRRPLLESIDPAFYKINLKIYPIFTKENSNCIMNGLRKVAELLAAINIKSVPVYLTQFQLDEIQENKQIENDI